MQSPKEMSMTFEITSKEIKVTAPMQEKLAMKYAKLERFNIPMINPHVTISKDKNNIKKIEASIHLPQGQLLAVSEGEDLYAAITILGQKLERQLNKYSEKHSAHKSGKEQCRAGVISGEELPVEKISDDELELQEY
ncbi:MAG: ribosome-associated inhibitor A [Moritella dasanensis]|jgi:ribosome-associated inhibitor A